MVEKMQNTQQLPILRDAYFDGIWNSWSSRNYDKNQLPNETRKDEESFWKRASPWLKLIVILGAFGAGEVAALECPPFGLLWRGFWLGLFAHDAYEHIKKKKLGWASLDVLFAISEARSLGGLVRVMKKTMTVEEINKVVKLLNRMLDKKEINKFPELKKLLEEIKKELEKGIGEGQKKIKGWVVKAKLAARSSRARKIAQELTKNPEVVKCLFLHSLARQLEDVDKVKEVIMEGIEERALRENPTVKEMREYWFKKMKSVFPTDLGVALLRSDLIDKFEEIISEVDLKQFEEFLEKTGVSSHEEIFNKVAEEVKGELAKKVSESASKEGSGKVKAGVGKTVNFFNSIKTPVRLAGTGVLITCINIDWRDVKRYRKAHNFGETLKYAITEKLNLEELKRDGFAVVSAELSSFPLARALGQRDVVAIALDLLLLPSHHIREIEVRYGEKIQMYEIFSSATGLVFLACPKLKKVVISRIPAVQKTSSQLKELAEQMPPWLEKWFKRKGENEVLCLEFKNDEEMVKFLNKTLKLDRPFFSVGEMMEKIDEPFLPFPVISQGEKVLNRTALLAPPYVYGIPLAFPDSSIILSQPRLPGNKESALPDWTSSIIDMVNNNKTATFVYDQINADERCKGDKRLYLTYAIACKYLKEKIKNANESDKSSYLAEYNRVVRVVYKKLTDCSDTKKTFTTLYNHPKTVENLLNQQQSKKKTKRKLLA